MKKIILLTALISVQGWAQKEENFDPEVDLRGIQNYEMKRFIIANGGGTVESGNYKLSSTIGQSVAHDFVTSGDYKLRGGFWYTLLDDVIFENGFEPKKPRSAE